jgi:hypothetical protein
MSHPLHTWKLTPTTIPSALWYLSSMRTQVLVRAAGPLEARELAAARFRQWQPQASPAVSASPWLDPDLVCCTEAHDERLAQIAEPCVVPE